MSSLFRIKIHVHVIDNSNNEGRVEREMKNNKSSLPGLSAACVVTNYHSIMLESLQCNKKKLPQYWVRL